jgi:hypothetical protein
MHAVVRRSLVLLIVVATSCTATPETGKTPGAAASATSPGLTTDDASSNCPVTKPNGKVASNEAANPNGYGNDQIITGLWPDGVVVFRSDGPGVIGSDGSLSMKWFWWRVVPGNLVIEGRRIDKPAPALASFQPSGYGQVGFQSSDITFAGPGCWEVTGRVGDARLTFVTRVVRQ